MPVPQRIENHPDLLDPRFERIFFDTFNEVEDMVSDVFTIEPDNGRQDMMWSSEGEFDDFDEWDGSVNYDSVSEGYDVIQTHVEFASGFQLTRTMVDYDQQNIMMRLPAALGRAAARTRQKHAARLFNNAFSVDDMFASRSEGVPLCSNSHTTTSGASTATGFDNLATGSLTATALTAARIQFVNFRNDRGGRISNPPDEIWIPPDLYEQAYEIVASMGNPENATNARNVHENAYTVREWIYLTDANNWFLCNSMDRKAHCHWVDSASVEFANAEDIDTILRKYRAYMRYSQTPDSIWQWILGHNVS